MSPLHNYIRLLVVMVAVLLLMACGRESGPDATAPGDVTPSGDQPTLPVDTPASQSIDSSAKLDADDDGLLTQDEHVEAVRLAFNSYRWPDLYTPTVDAMLASLENAPPGEHFFEVGLEHTVIGTWHQCAWYMAWLDAYQSGDSAAEAEALHVMANIIPASAVLESNGVDHLMDIAESAALGDSSGVSRMIDGLGCRDRAFDIDEAQGRAGS